MTTKPKKCSRCSATNALLKREMKELEPMLRRIKFIQRRDSEKPPWSGFSEDLFCN